MHPEILRELASQRGAEMRDRAHRIQLARTASKIQRARRRGLSAPGEADEFAVPPIPDFADGSFLVTTTGAGAARAEVAGSPASQPGPVPASRRAS